MKTSYILIGLALLCSCRDGDRDRYYDGPYGPDNNYYHDGRHDHDDHDHHEHEHHGHEEGRHEHGGSGGGGHHGGGGGGGGHH